MEAKEREGEVRARRRGAKGASPARRRRIRDKSERGTDELNGGRQEGARRRRNSDSGACRSHGPLVAPLNSCSGPVSDEF